MPILASSGKHVPTVLVVDDDPDANALIAGALKLKGYTPYEAHTDQECVELLEAFGESIDAVALIGAIAMESGAQLCARARKANPAVKILAVGDQESDRTAMMRLRADQVAIKPISVETLVDKVTLLLAESGAMVKEGFDGR
jgi:DNA-binding response OmpR family regulator